MFEVILETKQKFYVDKDKNNREEYLPLKKLIYPPFFITKKISREFPGGLVVRILGFHCQGPGSSVAREWTSYKPWHGQKMNPKQQKENVSRRCQQSLGEQNHSQLRSIYLDWQVSSSVLRPHFFFNWEKIYIA